MKALTDKFNEKLKKLRRRSKSQSVLEEGNGNVVFVILKR